uniref:Uncharacterized protein n=1 Tax=Vespula pensylvanica TaxID=30213 RepID=A0A834UAI5_VESPE|nr:hypothetical protein H0235_008164 [Vespula pensylvanica]
MPCCEIQAHETGFGMQNANPGGKLADRQWFSSYNSISPEFSLFRYNSQAMQFSVIATAVENKRNCRPVNWTIWHVAATRESPLNIQRSWALRVQSRFPPGTVMTGVMYSNYGVDLATSGLLTQCTRRKLNKIAFKSRTSKEIKKKADVTKSSR